MSSIPPHVATIYRKPAEAIDGTAAAPIYKDYAEAQYVVYNYEHTIVSNGGDDTAKFSLDVSPGEAEYIFWNYVGNRVAIHVDTPHEAIFEGIITTVALAEGATKRERTLDDMANALFITYTDSGGNTQTSPVVSTDSAAIYGWKSLTFDLNEQHTSGAGIAGVMANTLLTKLSTPPVSFNPNTGGSFNLEIIVSGFYKTLDWECYEVTSTTSESAGTILARAVFGAASTTTSYSGYNSSTFTTGGVIGHGRGRFYDDVDFSLWQDNTAFNKTPERKGGTTILEQVQQIVEAGGTGGTQWVWGITRTDPNVNYRRVYYRPVNTDIEYQDDPAGTGRIFNQYGQYVRPWTVTPDRSIFLNSGNYGFVFSDIATGRYIKKVKYNANSQSVVWTGENDRTLSGYFRIGEVVSPRGVPFGAPKRQTW